MLSTSLESPDLRYICDLGSLITDCRERLLSIFSLFGFLLWCHSCSVLRCPKPFDIPLIRLETSHLIRRLTRSTHRFQALYPLSWSTNHNRVPWSKNQWAIWPWSIRHCLKLPVSAPICHRGLTGGPTQHPFTLANVITDNCHYRTRLFSRDGF